MTGVQERAKDIVDRIEVARSDLKAVGEVLNEAMENLTEVMAEHAKASRALEALITEGDALLGEVS